MKIGYARISTQDQNFNLQIDALKNEGCEKIIRDTMSGAKKDRDYYRTAKIKNATLHTLRKSFGSLLIQEGHADIYKVSKLLGHSSVKVTERHYIHLLDENYQTSINGLDNILKPL